VSRSAQGCSTVCPAVAVALCIEELGRLRALEQLPTPELLMERLQARDVDFPLLSGVVAAYLKTKGVCR